MVGDELESLIFKIVGEKPNGYCSCNKSKNLMNVWGEKCSGNTELKFLSDILKMNTQKWINTHPPSLKKRIIIGIRLILLGINPFNPYKGLIELSVELSKE